MSCLVNEGGGGRGNSSPIIADSDSVDEEDLVEMESRNDDFIVDPILGDDDDNDSNDNDSNDNDGEVQRRGGYTALDPNALGDERHKLTYEFDSGPEPSYQSMEHYQYMSEIDMVLSLSEGFFTSLRECSNRDPRSNITMKDLYLYHAFLVLRTLHGLSKMEMYWDACRQGIHWSNEFSKLLNMLTLTKIYDIRKRLKGYYPDDDVPIKSRGWKVARPVNAVQESFRKVLTSPGEYLSVDEGIARGSSCRNPIYVSLGEAKPLEGFRFFILCDYKTKIIVNFILDTNDLNAVNCAARPGMFTGAVIDTLCSRTVLPGRNYKILADNYYNSYELAHHMLHNREILVCGTIQRKHTPHEVHFGNATRPKPSKTNPKGSLKMAKSNKSNIYIYAWMDSAGVYFIDPMMGPGHVETITRKNSVGMRTVFSVPSMISMYNKYMHGVDVFGQVRKYLGCDLTNATKKYTVRVFEILFSMILAQAYNIHRYVHRNTQQRMDRADFMVRVIHGFMQHPVVTEDQIAPTPHQLKQFPLGSRNDGKTNRRATEDQVAPTFAGSSHQLKQFPLGSRNDGTNRRSRVACRACSNTTATGKKNHQRTTAHYCSVCQVGFHPECFTEYHKCMEDGGGMSSRKRARGITANNSS